MSASSKKKLRNEQAAQKMTERQQQEQKEAKKLKVYTVIFSVVIVVMLLVALGTVAYRAVVSSGVLARSTTAATVGTHELSSNELNYFFVDAVYKYYSETSSYISYFMNLTTPLDQQAYFGGTEGETWADHFMESALNSAAAVYALSDAAKAEGFTLPEDVAADIDTAMESLDTAALSSGYDSGKAYLKAMYGSGATLDSYREYLETSMLAQSYQDAHEASLVYDDAALRAAETENYDKYSAFSYNLYYVDHEKFLTGGTTAEDGTTTYTDAETEAARAEAEKTANALVSGEYASLSELDEAIAALSINAESETAVHSTAYEDYAYSSINSLYLDWIVDDARVAGDMTVIANTSGEEGSEVTNGYYVLYFVGEEDNIYPLANVRHILITPDSSTYDSTTGTYSDEGWDAAEVEANALLEEWKAGEMTEDSFAALANEHSADGDGTTGGLYTDIYPGQMVEEFENWCFDNRKAGDTGIVVSTYGYHIMFYSGDSETIYRDMLIENDLLTTDMNNWYASLVDPVTTTLHTTEYVRTNMVLSYS